MVEKIKTQKFKDDEEDSQESLNLINKELDLIDSSINEYLGGDLECQYKQDLEQSELARSHLETLYSQ